MPRQVTHIKAFHGGLNDIGAASDIEDHECQEAQNCKFSIVGQLKPSGKFNNSPSGYFTKTSNAVVENTGLFPFSLEDTEYYGTASGTDGKTIAAINASGSTAIGTWSTASPEANFLFHNGILRVSDGAFGASNTRFWWGRTKHEQFPGLSEAVTGSALTATHANIPRPTAGVVRTSAATADVGTINFKPNAATNGTIPAGNYSFGYTFIYDHVQESRVFKMTFESGTAIAIAADGSLDAGVVYMHGVYNRRLTGFRIYIQDQGTYDGDWRMLIDIDVSVGYRLGLGEAYRGTFVDGSNGEYTLTLGNITRLGPETYKSINGYKADELIDCEYKSAVVCDGIVYAGHVKQGGITYPDRILKCAIPVDGIAADVFPASHYLDVGAHDGDDIVKLHAFADRVLVFKKKGLAVIAYSQSGVDYIENSYPHLGIDHPGAAFATPRGILFMNSIGVHLYTGETILNLTGKAIKPMFTAGFNSGDFKNPEKRRVVGGLAFESAPMFGG